MHDLTDEQIQSIEQGYRNALECLTSDCDDYRESANFPDDAFTMDNEKIDSLITDIVKMFLTSCTTEQIKQYIELRNEPLNHAMIAMGHDIYLTSEGHGAGFWDRGHGELGEQLTELCEPLSTLHVFYDDETQLITAE